MNSSTAGTRRFESPADIEREPGFTPDAPIDVESYALLLGWYAFADEEMKCCVLKPSGTLCVQQHRRGWVARRKDQVVTVIGGDCAKDKFAAGSIALEDMRRAEREINRLEREARLQALLADRDARTAEIDEVYNQLRALMDRLDQLAQEIGSAPWARVRLLGNSGSGVVSVMGYTPATRDADGDIISPRKEVRIPVGLLHGVRACAPERIKRELLELGTLRRQYAEQLPPEGPKRSAAVKALNAALGAQPQRIAQARQLLQDGELFEQTDLTPIVVFSSDPGVRVKLAQIAHRRSGRTLSRSAAKDWLQAHDRQLLAAHGVTKLHI